VVQSELCLEIHYLPRQVIFLLVKLVLQELNIFQAFLILPINLRAGGRTHLVHLLLFLKLLPDLFMCRAFLAKGILGLFLLFPKLLLLGVPYRLLMRQLFL
jgi:hypothetical protein